MLKPVKSDSSQKPPTPATPIPQRKQLAMPVAQPTTLPKPGR